MFLYNPNSGRGKIKKKLHLIERTLKKKYDAVDIYATKSAEDVTEKIRESAERYDTIVFSGGDGTFNNVLQGMGENEVKLGYLPSGTANDVAHSLGIPKRVKGALKIITKGHTDKVDCMRVGEHYAMYIAAAGAFTDVSYDTPQKKKRRLGWLAYVFALPRYFNFKCHTIKVTCGEKSETVNAVLTFIINGRSVSGFFVNKRGSMQDGILEAVVIRGKDKLNFWKRLCLCFHIVHFFLFGYKSRKKYIEHFRGDKIEIQADEGLVWDFDGEKGTNGNITAEVLQRRVTMFVPKNKKI